MSDPQITFVVLSYNFAPFLLECVESIFRQRGRHDFDIVLVDDASTDGTSGLLDRLADRRLRIVRHAQNRGHVATINEAMALARGRYVARIDGDDRYRPEFLETVLPIFEKWPEVGLVYGNAAIMDGTGRITAPRSDRVHHGADAKGNELVALLEENFICAPSVIARREAWQDCLPVPEGLAFHDWYFTVMMARRHEFYYSDRVLADYRVHAGNHHSRIIRDRTEEPSIFRVLDQVFRESESSPALEQAKQAARRRIVGRHYRTLADKYFGARMNADARRCYCAAIRQRPSYALDAGVQRRLAATVLGRRPYELGKSLLRPAASRS